MAAVVMIGSGDVVDLSDVARRWHRVPFGTFLTAAAADRRGRRAFSRTSLEGRWAKGRAPVGPGRGGALGRVGVHAGDVGATLDEGEGEHMGSTVGLLAVAQQGLENLLMPRVSVLEMAEKGDVFHDAATCRDRFPTKYRTALQSNPRSRQAGEASTGRTQPP